MRAPIALLILSACSEYAIEPKDEEPTFEEEDPVLYPDVVVTPTTVDLGRVCAGTTRDTEVEVRNAGHTTLNVRAVEVAGEGWSVTDPAPAALEPGEVLAVALTGGPGDALLKIHTDDPDSPTVEVPLYADTDAPPTVELRSPADGLVLPGDAVATFAGTVSDDTDAPDLLAVSWASDTDGVFSTAAAASTGEALASWDPAAHTSGSHRVTLTATDSCGQSVTESVTICQDQGYTADNLDLSTWHFEGSSRWDGANGWVELTTPAYDQSGTAFQTASTVGADNVSIEFTFFVSGGSGADGISVTALDTSRMTSFVGATGGGIGYMGLPGWSIEVDTWYNAEYADPTEADHVSIHFDGDPMNPVAWAALPEMEDGAWHNMQITVLAPRVVVTIDGVPYIDQDLSGFTAFPAYVGFTAATGGSTNFHLIDALTVTRYVCEEG